VLPQRSATMLPVLSHQTIILFQDIARVNLSPRISWRWPRKVANRDYRLVEM